MLNYQLCSTISQRKGDVTRSAQSEPRAHLLGQPLHKIAIRLAKCGEHCPPQYTGAQRGIQKWHFSVENPKDEKDDKG